MLILKFTSISFFIAATLFFISCNSVTTQGGGTSTNLVLSYDVPIQFYTFEPSSLTVPAGSTVTWVNHDTATHTVTSTGGPQPFNSGNLTVDAGYSFTFTISGTNTYRCNIHTYMTGTVIITN